jgi:hypothetical protein
MVRGDGFRRGVAVLTASAGLVGFGASEAAAAPAQQVIDVNCAGTGPLTVEYPCPEPANVLVTATPDYLLVRTSPGLKQLLYADKPPYPVRANIGSELSIDVGPNPHGGLSTPYLVTAHVYPGRARGNG